MNQAESNLLAPLTLEEFRIGVRVLVDYYSPLWDRTADLILERLYRESQTVETAVSECAAHLLTKRGA